MKKYYLLILALATMMVACSKDSESLDNSTPVSKDNTTVATQQPVTFDAYVNRATTRAGAEGVLKTSETGTGKVSLENEGFGVFSYYTDDDLYSSIYQPNFMYNTKVDKTSGSWAYSPVRYWPNEFGANAASEGVDRLSFFAYAPWVQVTPTTGIVTGESTYGIVGLSRNAATGDPFVKYYVNLDPAHQVDFCWGVNEAGKLNIDMTKQGINEKVSFQFKHALAALNVQIDAAVDEFTPGNKTLGAETHIYVRSVTFEGFVMKGAFNLNTEHAIWYDLAGNNYIDGGSVTVYDGRTNGREGQSESVNESPIGLNDVIVQSKPYSGTPTDGVTNEAVNLFNNTAKDASVYVIPSNQPLMVTIVYDVETQNQKLTNLLSDGETPGTSIENKITKVITVGSNENLKLEAGKQYTLKLHLGMTSVKFDASVNAWENASSAASTDLPINFTSLGNVTFSETSANVWVGQTVTTPTVTVTDGNNTDLTSVSTISWSSNNTSVATVHPDTGAITVVGAGEAKITATAEYDGMTKSADFTVNVNEVTGISVASATASVAPNGTTTLTATLTHTNNGTITSWPTVTWSSGDTSYFTVDPAESTASNDGTKTTATTVATAGATEGTSAITITATVGAAFLASNTTVVPATVDLTCENAAPAPTAGYFRGYDISKGILVGTENAGHYTYSLTNGDNPFELYDDDHYGNAESLNKYYHTWSTLYNELGAEGDNIDTDSDELPAYSGGGRWTMPTIDEWETILSGAPLQEIKVGNTTITSNDENKAWALVKVSVGTSSYYGVMVLRDGSTISAGLLDEDSLGEDFGDFSDNEIDLDVFNELIAAGCVFISCGGYYVEGIGWYDMKDTYWADSGSYWSSSYYNGDGAAAFYMHFDEDYAVVFGAHANKANYYYPVRLVKKIVP